MLPHAATRGGRSRQGRRRGAARRGDARALYRQGLRHRRAGAVLRADAEIRMAADRAGRPGGEEAVARRPSMSPNTSSTSPARRAWRPACEPLGGGVTLHIACHARAQNMGQKAAEMLRLVARDAEVNVIERCSGHGGSWGVMKENFETALKVGKPVVAPGVARPEAVRRLGMPARRHAYPAGHGDCWRTTRQLPARSVHPIELRRARLRARPADRAEPVTRTRMNASHEAHSAAADPRRHPAARRIRQDPPRAAPRDLRDQEAAAGRGRPVRDLLFREFRRRCGSRSRRCSTSRRAARRRSRTSWRPTTR